MNTDKMDTLRSLAASAVLLVFGACPGVAEQGPPALWGRSLPAIVDPDNVGVLDYIDLDAFVNDWLWTGRPGDCDADLYYFRRMTRNIRI